MTSITCTGVLDVSRATAEALAKLLLEHRERLGTRKGTRALGPFKQSVLILRWFLDDTRLTQLARDNRISVPTAYRYLHEGLPVLADHAPDLSTALERATAAGFIRLVVRFLPRGSGPAGRSLLGRLERSRQVC